jgi:protein transport protein SEC24
MNSVKEAKDALANVAIDYLNAYTNVVTKQQKGSLLTPYSLRLVPLYVLALMKSVSKINFGNKEIKRFIFRLHLNTVI